MESTNFINPQALSSTVVHAITIIYMGLVIAEITIYGKTFEVKNFRGFHGFSLNCECFPTNYGLVDCQFKSTSMLP